MEAIPDWGYHFTCWCDGSTENPRIGSNITGDISVTAHLAINVYTIEASPNQESYGSVSGTSNYLMLLLHQQGIEQQLIGYRCGAAELRTEGEQHQLALPFLYPDHGHLIG